MRVGDTPKGGEMKVLSQVSAVKNLGRKDVLKARIYETHTAAQGRICRYPKRASSFASMCIRQRMN